jgi:hypothetical protein
MKGIELPINILVIIAVAVIVLLGVIALYFSGFMGPARILDQNSAKQKYCAVVMRSPNGCQGGMWLDSVQIPDFDANENGNTGTTAAGVPLDAGPPSANNWCWTTAPSDPLAGACGVQTPCGTTAPAKSDNLASLLACYYGITKESDALKACGCA